MKNLSIRFESLNKLFTTVWSLHFTLTNKMAIEGKMRTHKTWRDSGLKWTDMVGF